MGPFGGENAESYYDEGLTASMKGDLARAVACLEKAIRLDNTFVAAYHQLGKCYMRMGQSRQAVAILEHVVSRKPGLVPPRLDLGFALVGVGANDKAKEHFAQVLAVDPNNSRAHLGLANVHFQQTNWPAAVAEAQTAQASGGQNFSVLYMLGRAARLAGEPMLAQRALEDAGALIEKSLELSANQPESHYLRGEVRFAQEQFASALENYRAAETCADPQRVYTAFGETFTLLDVLSKQALCYQRLGKADRARELAERIVALDPEHKLGQSLRALE